MPVSVRTYEQLALEDPEGHWELVCGRPRQKPAMSQPHNTLADELGFLLWEQLRGRPFVVRREGRTRRGEEYYFLPDVMVIPLELWRAFREIPRALEVYAGPLALVAEVWSPSTGEYDIDTKLPEYQLRGEAEIWRLHPYERTLIRWIRQPDGTYREDTVTGGAVALTAIPGVTIDLDTLFATLDR